MAKRKNPAAVALAQGWLSEDDQTEGACSTLEKTASRNSACWSGRATGQREKEKIRCVRKDSDWQRISANVS